MSRTVSLLARFEDPAASGDPRVRELVAKLGAVDYAPAPRAEFRDELRAQLVAIAGRVVAEGESGTTSSLLGRGPATLDPVAAAQAASPATVSTLERPGPRRSNGRRVVRPIGLAAACCAVLALGLGGAVWKSRSALPGDSLYGLKRASESVQLSLTSGDTARGHEYLKLATTRVQEARDLLGENQALASGSGVQAGAIPTSTQSLISSTLRSADQDVRTGASLLGAQAVTSHSATPLSIMTGWAPGQLQQLSQLATAVGTGPARVSTQQTWSIVHQALVRARTLQPQVGSHCAAARTDALGPIGCSSAAEHAPAPSVAPTRHHTKAGHTHPTRSAPRDGRSSAPTSAAPSGGTHRTRQPASSTPSKGLLPSSVPTLLPSTLPVSINSCGISAQIGPIGIGIGSCPSGS